MIYQGFTYEINATLDVIVRTYNNPNPDYSNFTFDWSGDWSTLFYATFVDTGTAHQPDIKFNKKLELSDSRQNYYVNVSCEVEDISATFSSVATDDGVVTFEIDEVLQHNSPDISVADAFVVEGEVALVEVCLFEPAYGEYLTVEYETSNGSAIASDGARPIGFDNTGVPFISITDDNALVQIAFDGGFPKYYNQSAGIWEVELLRNMILWSSVGRTGKVLFLGDANGSYQATSTAPTGFRSTLETTSTLIGRGHDLVTIDSITDYSSAQLAEYSCMVYIGGQSNAPLLPTAFINNIELAINLGMGCVLITDHDAFQYRCNQIAVRFNTQFAGNVDRTPIHVPTMVATYGFHPIFQNIDGTVAAGGSEGAVAPINTGDYYATKGTLTFEVGEKCKTIPIATIDNDDITGPQDFFLSIKNPSHGQITRDKSTILIMDNDVLPCGEAASSGGDGVAYYKFTSGSDPIVMGLANNAYSKHDRFDVYKNGIHLVSNMHEIDNNDPSKVPTYDRAEYDQVSGGDGNTVLELRQRKLDRAGACVNFMVMLPFFSSDPMFVDVRAEGPDGTGWDMATYCNQPVELDSGKVLDNRKFQRTDEPVLFDTLGKALYITLKLSPLSGGAFGSNGAQTGSGLDVGNSQAIDIPMRMRIFDSSHTQILVTSFAATGSSVSANISRDNSLSERFFYAVIEADYSVMPAGHFTPTYGGTGQSKPIRCCWELDVSF